MIPITVVRPDAEQEALVTEVLRSGALAQGAMVERFERCCATMAGTTHAVAVNNGTTALIAALRALGIGPGDEVITTPFTFVATLNAILAVGATAVFADIGTQDMNVDADDIERVLTERTRAVMPVHLYGQPADMERIGGLAANAGIAVVEDAAQAHGAEVGGRRVGGFGVATFSFYATKNLYCGEGGVVTTDDADVADYVRVLRNQGMRGRYEYELQGENLRLTNVAAAIAVPQFARLDAIVEARAANAAHFNAAFADLPDVVCPVPVSGRRHVWHQYTLRVTDASGGRRDAVVAALNEAGIGAGVYYPRLVDEYACFDGHPRIVRRPCPVAKATAEQVFSLPVHQYLDAADRAAIVDATRVALT
ncbi:MAG: DegT/DnrJ/EryC1/StrS family aminotransferase [Ilumatobacteraceae bacterium]